MTNQDYIYQKILKAIVEHQLPPGIRLPEDRLAEAFSISRTGIRKVLQRLAIEHFVIIQPNKGAHVNHPNKQEAMEVFDSRIAIEPYLISELMMHWELKKSAFFRKMVDKEKQADLANDLAASIQLTAKFHYELSKLAGNSILAYFVEQLCYRSSLIIAAYGSKNSVSCDCGDHNDFINILDNGDKANAQSWMKHHLIHIKSSLNITRNKNNDIDFNRLFCEEMEVKE